MSSKSVAPDPRESLSSVRFGGRISLIGVLTGFDGLVNPWPIIARSATVQGIYVGSTEMFTRMNAAITQHSPAGDRPRLPVRRSP